ncbi:hypothetical protein AAIH70_16510 [Neorhizobium sp. BT27B]|uniref:hypothetical protein n=1 Tax=Neorhizobium sp. BT27B TaxID=3142625 RepID=UPI003D2CDD3F
MTIQSVPPTHPAPTVMPGNGIAAKPCEFELYVFSKYDDVQVEVSGPTLGIAISHALPELRHLAHSRAVFGARLFPKNRRTYGAWEIIFPDEKDRPNEGYDQFGVRRAVGFDDSIEVFDVYQELDEYEGLLRYRAQDLGDDDRSREIIADGVANYVRAARHAMLWDPRCKLNILKELDKLFQKRDWGEYVSRDAFIAPTFAIDDVRVIAQTDKNEYLVGFRYQIGESHGFDMEFVDVKRRKPKVRRDVFSALRSPVPIFRGDQLPLVYDRLQATVENLNFTR